MNFGHVVLSALTVALVACGGGSNSDPESGVPGTGTETPPTTPIDPPPTEPIPTSAVEVDLDPTSPRLFRYRASDGTVTTVMGDRTTTGEPARIRTVLRSKSNTPSPLDHTVTYDEQGRLLEVSNEQEGTLRVQYYTSGVERYTWQDAETNREFEIFLTPEQISSANLRIQAQAENPISRPATGEVLVTCSRNGANGPMPSVLVTVTKANKNGAHYTWASGITDSNGVFRYPMPTFSGREVTRNGQRPLIEAVLGSKCSNKDYEKAKLALAEKALVKKIEETAPPDPPQNPQSSGLDKPQSWGKIAARAVNGVAEVIAAVGKLCDGPDNVFDALTNQGLTAVDDHLTQQNLSAQARTAAILSPKADWSVLKSDTSVPQQQLQMPEEACPARLLEGTWSGGLSQPNNPLIQSYGYTMTLQQSGTALTGTSRITSGSYFGDISVSGVVSNNSARIQDRSITSQMPPPNIRWCIKSSSYSIRNVNGLDSLTGSFTASGCEPGTYSLSRQ